MRRSRSEIRDFTRPAAALLLTGPTGVGKTELCRALAELVYGTKDALIRLDMSEYMDKFTSTRLIGAPPGYVGHDQGGELTEKVRRRPHCLLLLDEVDKAHPDVLNLLLQVMEEGVLTDAMGRHADFRHAVVVMTCNLGAEQRTAGLGFAPDAQRSRIRQAVRQHFTPEFLGRLDAVVPFCPLDEESLQKIAARELEDLKERMARCAFRLEVDEACTAVLAQLALKENAGARGIRTVLRSLVEDPASQILLCGGRSARVDVMEDPDNRLHKTIHVRQ